MPRLIGIDYGSKRIGIAVGDSETGIASPLQMIDGRNDATRDARAVSDLGIEQEAAEFVVGLPLNLDTSTDSEQTAVSRRFAAELARLSGKPVRLQDERLTTAAAEDVLAQAEDRGRRRGGRKDAIAAQKILQMYLDDLSG